MPIFHNYKTILIHIPKTAGTSMENIMGLDRLGANINKRIGKRCLFGPGGIHKYGSSYQHLTLQQVKQEVNKEIYEEYFKFCFVRNPWDRLVSEFFWTHQHSSGTISDKIRKKNIYGKIKAITRTRPLTWECLFADLENRDIKKYRSRLVPQINFIKDEAGKTGLDFIGKFENIINDWSVVADFLALPLTLHHKVFDNGFAGFLINNTEHVVYVQVDDMQAIKISPGEQVDAFPLGDLDRKREKGVFYLNIEGESGDEKYEIPANWIRKSMKMNVKYYHGIDEDIGIPCEVGYMDEFFNFNFDCKKLRKDIEPIPLTGLSIDYNRSMKTERGHYRKYYDDKTRKIVAKFYEEDIDEFKYTF